MYQLAKEGMPITLAVSLHAPNDALRRRIMPITDKYPLDAVLTAAHHYFEETGRKVTFEYILIKNLTCTHACAKELARLFSGKNILINAIPINDNYDVASTGLTTSPLVNSLPISSATACRLHCAVKWAARSKRPAASCA